MATASQRPNDRPPIRPKSDATVTMRVPAQLRDLIDSAAAALGTSRTEFVLDSARRRAAEVLLDRRVFNLDAEASEAFAAALAAPAPPNEALRSLMAGGGPWA